jgi:hypothetical protein
MLPVFLVKLFCCRTSNFYPNIGRPIALLSVLFCCFHALRSRLFISVLWRCCFYELYFFLLNLVVSVSSVSLSVNLSLQIKSIIKKKHSLKNV